MEAELAITVQEYRNLANISRVGCASAAIRRYTSRDMIYCTQCRAYRSLGGFCNILCASYVYSLSQRCIAAYYSSTLFTNLVSNGYVPPNECSPYLKGLWFGNTAVHKQHIYIYIISITTHAVQIHMSPYHSCVRDKPT